MSNNGEARVALVRSTYKNVYEQVKKSLELINYTRQNEIRYSSSRTWSAASLPTAGILPIPPLWKPWFASSGSNFLKAKSWWATDARYMNIGKAY